MLYIMLLVYWMKCNISANTADLAFISGFKKRINKTQSDMQTEVSTDSYEASLKGLS